VDLDYNDILMKLENSKKLIGALCLVFSAGCLTQQKAKAPNYYASQRTKMVAEQLKSRDIVNQKVLEAMEKVPRHEFVLPEYRSQAYGDFPLPIGMGQTISQPYIVAFMTQAVKPQPTDKVLEVGTGSGYQAAVLAELVKEVYTIEIVQELADTAKARLKRLKYDNVHVRFGDGYLGWKEAAPFDVVVVTAGADHVPQPLLEQLKPKGRLIMPVGAYTVQELQIHLKDEEGKIRMYTSHPVRFVPLTRLPASK